MNFFLDKLTVSIIIETMINCSLNDDNLVGKHIEIISMEGEKQYSGKRGIVKYVDSVGQIHGTWGGCALIPGVDSWREID